MMDKKETFGAEIAKQMPVKEIYNDLAHPALSTVGESIQGVIKLALAPVTGMIWGYEKIAAYLDEAIPAYFERKKIEKEKIVTPDPSVAVPAIEALRYSSHKPELREMFVNLLGASMDADNIDEHPAFVEIIKQLSSDECKILKYLYGRQVMPMLKIRLKIDNVRGEVDGTKYFSDIGYLTECTFPQKFPEYLDNLHRLGLVEIHYDRWLVDNELYKSLKEHPEFPKTVNFPQVKPIEKKSMYGMSEFGKKFCDVCVS